MLNSRSTSENQTKNNNRIIIRIEFLIEFLFFSFSTMSRAAW